MTTKSRSVVREADRPYWRGVGKFLRFHNPSRMCSWRLRLISIRAVFIEDVSHYLLQSANVEERTALPTGMSSDRSLRLFLFFPPLPLPRTSLHQQLLLQQALLPTPLSLSHQLLLA